MAEAEQIAFWAEFTDLFGEVGSDPVGFYRFEVGHVLHVTPEQVGELTPADLMAAVTFFDAMYRSN